MPKSKIIVNCENIRQRKARSLTKDTNEKKKFNKTQTKLIVMAIAHCVRE